MGILIAIFWVIAGAGWICSLVFFVGALVEFDINNEKAGRRGVYAMVSLIPGVGLVLSAVVLYRMGWPKKEREREEVQRSGASHVCPKCGAPWSEGPFR